MRGNRKVFGGGALIEDSQHGLGKIARVDVVTGPSEGDSKSARRAAHVQDRVAGRGGE